MTQAPDGLSPASDGAPSKRGQAPRLSTRLAATLAAVIGLVFLAVALAAALREARMETETRRAGQSAMARSLAGALAEPVWKGDSAIIRAMGEAGMAIGAARLGVMDHAGSPLFHAEAPGPAGALEEERFALVMPVAGTEREIGALEVAWPRPSFARLLLAQLPGKAAMLAAMAAAAVAVGVLAARRFVARPLAELGAAIERARRQPEPEPLAMDPPAAEFAPMIEAYNHLVAEVRARDGELRARLADARRADEAKSQFLAMMSHELRTPLNAVIGFSSIIRDEMFGPVNEPRYRDYAGDIYEAGEHLLGIINDMLDLTRLEHDKASFHPGPTPTAEILRAGRVVGEARSGGRGTRVELVESPMSTAEILLVDGRLVKQALINLVDNALKASPPEGVVRVWCVDRAGGGVAFVVEDAGAGFGGRDVEALFEPFARHENAYVREQQAGLGLPIARKLMRLHGGDVTIDAQAPGGGRVSLILPEACVVSRRAARALAE